MMTSACMMIEAMCRMMWKSNRCGKLNDYEHDMNNYVHEGDYEYMLMTMNMT